MFTYRRSLHKCHPTVQGGDISIKYCSVIQLKSWYWHMNLTLAQIKEQKNNYKHWHIKNKWNLYNSLLGFLLIWSRCLVYTTDGFSLFHNYLCRTTLWSCCPAALLYCLLKHCLACVCTLVLEKGVHEHTGRKPRLPLYGPDFCRLHGSLASN